MRDVEEGVVDVEEDDCEAGWEGRMGECIGGTCTVRARQ
jgi:hypothetical protein